MMEAVRVRFAPAPSGHLHIGNVHTCLFNWLFARRWGGTVVLRIEDTDSQRTEDSACATIVDDLRWIGLDWDEGYAVGGPCGPYRQSERLDAYHKYAERLLSEGNAYLCYCTPDELEEERRRTLARGEMPRYGGKCRDITTSDAEELAKKRRPAVRFRVPDETVVVEDMIKGPISFDGGTIGDFVILRSDGVPTYNFAAVVDDAEMGITHIIRGDEHVSNTPRQMMLYNALGLPHPRFGHVAMILGPDKAKLSKRHGATSLAYYREAGYLPEALLNYLALLGWSPEGTREIMSIAEIAGEFSLERVSRSPAVFDQVKLDWFNSRYIRALSPDRLVDLALPYLAPLGVGADHLDVAERAWIAQALASVQDSLTRLSQVTNEVAFYFGEDVAGYDDSARTRLAGGQARAALEEFIRAVSTLGQFDEDEIRGALLEIPAALCVGTGKALLPIRAALTGRTRGPELHTVVRLLGRERAIHRARMALVNLE